MLALQNKLNNVESPSSSKEGEDEYDPEIDEDHLGEDGISSDASASIPMAHREYEKTMRQLEAECRTHIKCEQQMKLHIECLQEKLDQIVKENEQSKQKLEHQIIDTDKQHQIELKKFRDDLKALETQIKLKAEEVGALRKQNDLLKIEFKNEKKKHDAKLQSL